MIWQIASATGWSVQYIMWGINYQTLLMMLNDAPHYVKEKNNKRPVPATTGQKPEGGSRILNFFQSRL